MSKFLPVVAIVLCVPGLPARALPPEPFTTARLAEIATDRLAHPAARFEALRMLGRLGPQAAEVVPILSARLGRFRPGDDLEWQEAIIDALARIGPPARSALPPIAYAAGQHIDIDLAIRRATESIMRPAGRADVDGLIRELANPDASGRLRAAKLLAEAGPPAETAIPQLAGLLQDPDPDVRRAAVRALGVILPESRAAPEVLFAVAADLRDPDPAARLAAVKRLSDLGPAARPVLDLLREAASADDDPDVRRAAQQAAGRFTGR